MNTPACSAHQSFLSCCNRICRRAGIYISLLAILVGIGSCSNRSDGMKKDLNTGIITHYSNIEAAGVSLLLNDKELRDTDIPLGETFKLINEGIRGLTVRNGKVSIGCSLEIFNSIGKMMLHEADLFAGKDLLNAEDASLLQCSVNTGAPMKWDEHYKVNVHFWDKYGNGKIDNTLVIRAVDKP